MKKPRKAPQRHRFIALLRAINVGGHVVKMDVLRAQFEALGFTRVETFIASGNVIFDAESADAPAMEQQIERALRAALDYEVATFIRTPGELAAAAAHPAFPGTAAGDAKHPVYVAFTRSPVAAAAQRALIDLRNDIDDFHVNGREIYWARRIEMGESRFTGARLEKIIGMPATSRNITTVRRLAALTAVD